MTQSMQATCNCNHLLGVMITEGGCEFIHLSDGMTGHEINTTFFQFCPFCGKKNKSVLELRRDYKEKIDHMNNNDSCMRCGNPELGSSGYLCKKCEEKEMRG